MMDFLIQARRIGWLAVEALLLLVVLCVLLNIVLGADGGAFISSVAANAANFLASVPPGTLVGLVLIGLVVWYIRTELRR